MSDMFFHDTDTDALKLRVLLTNTCNYSCPYCLNEFQCGAPTKDKQLFLDPDFFETVVSQYVRFCKANDLTAEVYLSGGEPTMHPEFVKIADILFSANPDKTILCSNGSFIHGSMSLNMLSKIGNFSSWHISKHKSSSVQKTLDDVRTYLNILGTMEEGARAKDLLLSCVFHSKKCTSKQVRFVTEHSLRAGYGATEYWIEDTHRRIVEDGISEMASLYGVDLSFAVWADYWQSGTQAYMHAYEKFMGDNPWLSNRGTVFDSDTRGDFCGECDRKCPSTKAMWVFPNNSFYPCPQRQAQAWKVHAADITSCDAKREVQMRMAMAYYGHRVVKLPSEGEPIALP